MLFKVNDLLLLLYYLHYYYFFITFITEEGSGTKAGHAHTLVLALRHGPLHVNAGWLVSACVHAGVDVPRGALLLLLLPFVKVLQGMPPSQQSH